MLSIHMLQLIRTSKLTLSKCTLWARIFKTTDIAKKSTTNSFYGMEVDWQIMSASWAKVSELHLLKLLLLVICLEKVFTSRTCSVNQPIIASLINKTTLESCFYVKWLLDSVMRSLMLTIMQIFYQMEKIRPKDAVRQLQKVDNN